MRVARTLAAVAARRAADLHIVQESLTNVVKHANARAVTVRLAHFGAVLELDIADQGDAAAVVPVTPGRGQADMHARTPARPRARTQRLGAKLHVAVAASTRVELRVPQGGKTPRPRIEFKPETGPLATTQTGQHQRRAMVDPTLRGGHRRAKPCGQAGRQRRLGATCVRSPAGRSTPPGAVLHRPIQSELRPELQTRAELSFRQPCCLSGPSSCWPCTGCRRCR